MNDALFITYAPEISACILFTLFPMLLGILVTVVRISTQMSRLIRVVQHREE